LANHHPHIVIIGGGFGGLYAAKALRGKPARVTLVDRRNFHLFQPLLYQVATGGLSPGDIASPIRAVFTQASNIQVIQGEVVDLDPNQKCISLRDGKISYDALIIATGVRHFYFGNDHWAENAPGLKTVEEALDIRRRIFLAFEAAEREQDPHLRQTWLNFVLVGGGPTGVELAGALAELAQHTLVNDFRTINSADARIILLEGQESVLPSYPATLSAYAAEALSELGVEVRTKALLTSIQNDQVFIKVGEMTETLATKTVIWAAGVQGSSLGEILQSRMQAALDYAGRVMVTPELLVPGTEDIYVIGDLANFQQQGGDPLPGVAQVAMQQGEYAAKHILKKGQGWDAPPFLYRNKGNLAVIGRNKAVADLGNLQFKGRFAWFIWIFVHIAYLIEFDNRLMVLIQWAFDYFLRKRGARLITGSDPFPLVGNNHTKDDQ
jgi:NADH dehydrogenase